MVTDRLPTSTTVPADRLKDFSGFSGLSPFQDRNRMPRRKGSYVFEVPIDERRGHVLNVRLSHGRGTEPRADRTAKRHRRTWLANGC